MTERADVALADAHWHVTVAPERGMLIREAVDVPSGAAMLWTQTAPAPTPPSRELPPPGPGSRDTFRDMFAGGWFPMFPSAGFTGEVDGQPTHFHGELNRLPWEIIEQGPVSLEARVETVRAPFAVVRRVVLAGGALRIETAVRNAGDAPASFTYGEHPCFPFATFAGGRIELETRAAWVPHPALDPERSVLATGERFAWPQAPRRGGGQLDLSLLPARADGRHDHACVELASPRVRIGAPRFGRVLEMEADLAVTPYALVWENLDGAPVFAVEPTSGPGRGAVDALAASRIGRLRPGEGFRTAVVLRWEDMADAA